MLLNHTENKQLSLENREVYNVAISKDNYRSAQYCFVYLVPTYKVLSYPTQSILKIYAM